MFLIDSSWITNVEAAIKRYNKVITEFPKSAASHVAYQENMRTLLGWQETGRYSSKHGIKDYFVNYMPQLLETFTSYEKEHPDSSTLPAFR